MPGRRAVDERTTSGSATPSGRVHSLLASTAMPDTVLVSVIIPTIGRSELLAKCLESITSNDPAPAEIVVVDQSHSPEVAAVITAAGPTVRLVPCQGVGIARGQNLGLREATHDVAMLTNDDITVAPDWVGVAWKAMQADPAAIVTGRVLSTGEPGQTPSLRTEEHRIDYRGAEPHWGIMMGGNMAFPRRSLLEIGGWDERPSFSVAAEDNDLCYRWMKSGRPMYFEPDLVVWHHDWRTPDQMQQVYRNYSRGQGAFYAKHLYHGDRRMLRPLWLDVRSGLGGWIRSVARHPLHHSAEAKARLLGVPAGFIRGIFEERKLRRSNSCADR